MNRNKYAKITAVCVGALTLALASSTMAYADPTPAAFRTYAAVGSDTTQDVWNGLTNGTAATSKSVASYNAFLTGSLTIKTKSTGPVFKRPTGSGNGVLALSASNNTPFLFDNGAGGTVNIANQVNFARSSSGPSSSFPGTALTYIPFARDAVSIVGRNLSSGIASNFTTDQIRAIFSCTNSADGRITTAAGADPVYNASTTVKQQLNPLIPQAGSGTRTFFLAAAGLDGTTPAKTLGACVSDAAYPENDGTVLKTTGSVIPFSVAQWISQKNGVTTNTVATTSLKLTKINSSSATAGTAPTLTPGTLFGSASTVPVPGVGKFNRDTYNVVNSTLIGSLAATGLEKVLTTNLRTTASKSIISKYGFLPLTYTGDRTKYKTSGYTNS